MFCKFFTLFSFLLLPWPSVFFFVSSRLIIFYHYIIIYIPLLNKYANPEMRELKKDESGLPINEKKKKTPSR